MRLALSSNTVFLLYVESGGNGYHYLGSFIYQQSGVTTSFESANFGGGRVVYSNGSYSPYYYTADQLGSIRVITDGNGAVVERSDYYPFGEQHANSNYPQLSSNRWKFNGKELQTSGNTAFLDYGARMYDPTIARWGAVDPMAEKYFALTPYLFSGNNPIRYIDPDGRVIRLANNYARGMENIAKIVATSLGSDVMNHLIGQREIYTLKATYWTLSSSYCFKHRNIKYVRNPWYNKTPNDLGAFNSMIAMGHEIFHAFDHSINKLKFAGAELAIGAAEASAVSFENYLRSSYSFLPLRKGYGNIKGDFHQFQSNEIISNFRTLGNNINKTSYGFSYTKTTTIVEDSKTIFGRKIPKKTRTETATYYMTVSRDKDNNASFQIYNNKEEYKKVTSNW